MVGIPEKIQEIREILKNPNLEIGATNPIVFGIEENPRLLDNITNDEAKNILSYIKCPCLYGIPGKIERCSLTKEIIDGDDCEGEYTNCHHLRTLLDDSVGECARGYNPEYFDIAQKFARGTLWLRIKRNNQLQ